MARRPILSERNFFKIGEVSKLVGVKPHVLRYWESEFDALRPKKTRGSHRHFTRRDLDVAMQIKRLLHDEGYTIAGAKLRLQEMDGDVAPAPKREVALRAELIGLRTELARALEDMDCLLAPQPVEEADVEVRVEAVVPVTARRTRGG